MRQKELLDNIKKYLSRFETQVKISSSNNEYDINIHSENVIIPILNLIYGVELKNANYIDGKNAEAIDLLDESKGIAFQVTSNKVIEKIKSTISKFVNSKYRIKIDHLYIFILKEKQSNYSQEILDIARDNKIKFSAKENILDFSDLYRKLNERNDLKIIIEVEEILKNQFSDVYIDKSFTLQKLEEFKNHYRQSCIANFSRINFFGLAVNTNKPREIELYRLFVKPTFSSNGIDENNFRAGDEIKTLKNSKVSHINSRLIESPQGLTWTDKYHAILFPTVNISDFFTDSIIRLEDPKTLINFEKFHGALQKRVEIKFADLFSGAKNIVVIGKPGAGKSSFIKYSICKILEKDLTVFSNNDIYEYIPFRIELHKYNKYKKINSGGLIDYLNILLKTEYQQVLEIENIISILKYFPCIVFFDGLDEIFDIQERLDVRNDIESFIKNYQTIKSVVTSRYESYEEVTLSENLFSKFQLLDFNEAQVEEYVNKWYSIEESNSNVKQRESSNCLTQLKSVEAELKQNPLLLSLILLLYRNELDIPTSKLSIYESCTNTILETRDVKEKKLGINLKIVNKLSVFTSLAYWQFLNENENKGSLNFEMVRTHIVNYLIEKGEFSDENYARQATDEFLNFAKVRSIYFENKFTHKTFLEYFTAYYIYSFYFGNWRKADEFSTLLTNYIGLSAWSVVLELLICKIDSTQINYEIIDDLVEKLYEKNKIDTLIFFLQIIKYLKNISPRMTGFIISKSIDFCFTDGEATKELKIDYQEALFSHLSNLVSVERFKEIIEHSFGEAIKKDNINKLGINAFAYEFAIVSGNTSLVKLLQESNLEFVDEYIFILKHYPNLFDKSKFLESIKIFMVSFPISKTSEVYTSPFKQKIFFNSARFNWVISYLFCNVSKDLPYTLFRELIEAGVPKDIIINSAKEKSAEISNTELLHEITLPQMKDRTYKKLINRLQEKYIPMIYTELGQKIPIPKKFYDKFYKNSNKRGR